MRPILAVLLLLTLAACGVPDPATQERIPMGNFRLGHGIAVAPDPAKGPFSRDVTEEEWKVALEAEMQRRFAGYEGDNFYHIGMSVDGYVVAQPGIPLIYNPKSVVILGVTFWDDATQSKLNPEPKRITVLENLGSGFIIGSGNRMTKEEQVAQLSRNAVGAVQRWILQNPEWIGLDADEALAAQEGLPESLDVSPTEALVPTRAEGVPPTEAAVGAAPAVATLPAAEAAG